MDQDLFKNLPVEHTIDILCRLPFRNILVCKCVCKTWHDLLETGAFDASWHRFTGLAFLHYRDFEFFDLRDFDGDEWRPLMKFDFLDVKFLQMIASVKGLIFLRSNFVSQLICIWNPITREFINLITPESTDHETTAHFYGFGVSKITGQYKVVIIFQKLVNHYHFRASCQMYTLGTGSWRRIDLPQHEPCEYIDGDFSRGKDGVFLNGNLHWLVGDFRVSPPWISCLDLETELFTKFSCPHLPRATNRSCNLVTLNNSLCLYDDPLGDDYEVVIWMMKEYGVKESWTRQYTIGYDEFVGSSYLRILKPLAVTEEGDILMILNDYEHLHYSVKLRTVRSIRLLCPSGIIQPVTVIHTPTFASLKSFESEDVTKVIKKIKI